MSGSNIFEARLDNVKNISTVLKAINFKSSAVCSVSSCGLKFVVEDSKCIQANAFIGSDIFQEYTVNDGEDAGVFRIDLNILVDCLTIFDGCSTTPGASTALKMSYEGGGNPLKLILEEEGIITDCSLKTMTDCDTLDFDINESEVLCKIILRAPDFKEVLADLDHTSEFVEFSISCDPLCLKITTEGLAGKFEADIPEYSTIVESFVCTNAMTTRYRYSQIKPFLKSLLIATKVSIRITEEQLICLQFMIPTESKMCCYVEYYCAPTVEDD